MPERRPLSVSPWWESRRRTVLVADEDPERRLGVADLLGAGATVSWCGNGAEALWQAGRSDAAVVILSATLPGVSAAEVATVLAENRQAPGAIAVAVGAGETELAGPVLAAGANSVVSRPYRARELNALLVAYGAHPGEGDWPAVVSVGPLRLDLPAFEASASGHRLRLTLREFELLRLLMLHAGDVVSQHYIREQLWGLRGETASANTIAVHVRRLRGHLAGIADILAVRRLGYRLVVPREERPSRDRSDSCALPHAAGGRREGQVHE
jgi:DNA-binding response OmpR family regulator